jgi:hypothetical protein
MKNLKNIGAMLAQAQKGCSARLLESADVSAAIRDAEKKLSDLGISKKAWLGCKIVMQPEKVCNSYRQRAEGTGVTLVRAATVWQIESVARVACGKKAHGGYRNDKLVLSEAAVMAMPREFNV